MRVLTNTRAATTATTAATTTPTPAMIATGDDRGDWLAVTTVDVDSGVDEALIVGVRVELADVDAVEFANGVANGTMSLEFIGVWTDGVQSDGTFGLALAVLPT